MIFLQELLGHEDMKTVKNYMHMNDETIQVQKRKYSPGEHLPTLMPGPKETRRRGFRAQEQGKQREETEQRAGSMAVVNLLSHHVLCLCKYVAVGSMRMI